MRLEGRVALVTGAGRGIGRAIALALSREGAVVAAADRHPAGIQEVAETISASSGTAIPVLADVSAEQDVAGMVRHVIDTFGRIDILVNNAAVTLPYRAVVDLTLNEWNGVIAVNLTGPFLCARAVLPKMIEQRSGKIINISSSGARQGSPGRSPYRSAKAGLIIFTECLAAEVKQYGIDVNAVCPGITDTDMVRELRAGAVPERTMKPEEIASLVAFLASDEASAITGTAIDALGIGNPLFGPEKKKE